MIPLLPMRAQPGLTPEIRRRCEEFVRPLYAGLDGAQSFGRVDRVLARLETLVSGRRNLDRRHLELLVLFHGAVARLGSLESGGRLDLFLRGLGLDDEERSRLRLGLKRFESAARSEEECLLHDAVLLEEAGVPAAVARLMAAGKRRLSAVRAVRSLDPGPPAERFLTEEAASWARSERQRTETWIAELRAYFKEVTD